LVVILSRVEIYELTELQAVQPELDQLALGLHELLLASIDERHHRVLVCLLQELPQFIE
jgi:hypothetical protein